MNAPKFEAHLVMENGKRAIELVVRNASADADLLALVDSLGYTGTVDISNRRRIVCTTPDEIVAKRDPLAKFFDAKGNWK
jgi:hypothetical protein